MKRLKYQPERALELELDLELELKLELDLELILDQGPVCVLINFLIKHANSNAFI